MPFTESADVRLYYEVFGSEKDPVLVLISGGGAQLLSWDPRLVATLTSGGLRVVRFDNRDTGFSQRFGGVYVEVGDHREDQLGELAVEELAVIVVDGGVVT